MGITINLPMYVQARNWKLTVSLCLHQYEHVSPGKGQAFIRIKVKHMKTGRVLEKTIKSNDSLERAELIPRKVMYMYRDDQLHFMDNDTYEQFSLPPEALLGKDAWLKDNTEISLLFWNDEPVDVDIPVFMELEWWKPNRV